MKKNKKPKKPKDLYWCEYCSGFTTMSKYRPGTCGNCGAPMQFDEEEEPIVTEKYISDEEEEPSDSSYTVSLYCPFGTTGSF